MKRSLLYIVQRVMDKLDFDEVNSIEGTPESQQIAQEAETTFYDLMTREDWPHLQDLLTIESLSDTALPTVLRLPENVTRIDNIQYKTFVESPVDDTERTHYKDILYLKPREFMRQLQNRDDSADEVATMNYPAKGSGGDVELFIFDTCDPTYWTSFDDDHIVFDSYDKNLESTLIGIKCIGLGRELPTWSMQDDFIIDLPANMTSLFLAELTAAISLYYRQDQSPEDERRRNRGISRLRRKAHREAGFSEQNNFGRRNRRINEREVKQATSLTSSTAF